MALNFNNVTRGTAARGWTAASIAPAPVANIPMSGNVPSNILQAVGNLSAEQAFRNFLSTQLMGAGSAQPQVIVAPSIDPAAALQAQTAQAQQKAAESAAATAKLQLARNQQMLELQPSGFGGISPMGLGANRAALQQQQFGFENQLAQANAAAFGVPRMSGWMGGF